MRELILWVAYIVVCVGTLCTIIFLSQIRAEYKEYKKHKED